MIGRKVRAAAPLLVCALSADAAGAGAHSGDVPAPGTIGRAAPMRLAGIRVITSPSEVRPLKGSRRRRSDGRHGQIFGDIIAG